MSCTRACFGGAVSVEYAKRSQAPGSISPGDRVPAGRECALDGDGVRLTAKLTAAASVGIASVLALHAVMRIDREQDLFDDDLRRDHAALGEALAAAVEGVGEDSGLEGVEALIEEADAARGHLRIRWVRGPGPAERVSEVIERDGRRYLRTSVAAVVPGVVGHVELTESLEASERFVYETVVRTAVAALATLAVCAFAVHLAGRSIVEQPLAAIVRHIRRIGEGDWSVARRPSRSDEIGVLGVELDGMCHRLAELQAAEQAQRAEKESTLEQLRHAGRLATVGQLAAGVAHELGTPLNVISARAKMIVSGESSHEEALDDAKVIRAQTEKITRIIRQLLDFARRRAPERTLTDLSAIAGRALSMLESVAHQEGVVLRLAEGPPAFARVDAGQVEQVLTNLIMNGIQAQPDGGFVEVSVARDSIGAIFVVRDAGPGIPVDQRASVFEPFFTTKSVGEGTGLGLSVVLGLVTDHGGRVEIEDEPEGGARFSVAIPDGAND